MPFTSAAVGIDGAAPIRCTQMEARRWRKVSASRIGLPCASCAASAPTKQSPAPVVSTAFTLRPGMRIASPPTSASTPRAERDADGPCLAAQRARGLDEVVRLVLLGPAPRR